MNPTQLQTTQILQDYIKDLHNQSKVMQHRLIDKLKVSPEHTLILKLMNHDINITVEKIQQITGQQKRHYFEEPSYVISKQLKNIGTIAKYLGAYCQFQSSFQSYLAQFETVQFWRQYKEQQPEFIDYIKGIFPYINAHKDNIPLYTPLYQTLQSYTEIGNPNWQFSRQYLDKIYRSQILAIPDEQQNWYLLILGNKKLLEKYNQTIIQKIWSNLYYYYINQTLKPYRSLYQMDEENQITIESIKSLISHEITRPSVNLQMKIIFYIILNILTQTNYGYLNGASKTFNQLLEKENDDNQTVRTYGLINAQFYQLCRNYLEIYDKNYENNPEKYQFLKNIIKKTTDQNQILFRRRLPFSDFYSRIIYPNIIKNGQCIEDGNSKLFELYARLVHDSPAQNPFPFPKYPYNDNILSNRLVELYLENYPDQQLQYVKLLPSREVIWKLLNTKQLNNIQGFQKIKHFLSQRKQQYIQLILQKDPQFHKDDLNRFIQIWAQYHKFLQYEQRSNVLENHGQGIMKVKSFIQLMRESNFIASEVFKQQVSIPFQNKNSIFKVLQIFVYHVSKYFEGLLKEQNRINKDQIIYQCNSLISEPWFNQQILNRLTEQQRNELRQAWMRVQQLSPGMISDLGGAENKIIEQKIREPQNFIEARVHQNNNRRGSPEILELD